MFNKSKSSISSLDKTENYQRDLILLKQRNYDLAKEIAQMRSMCTSLQCDIDHVLTEKFTLERKLNTLNVSYEEIDHRCRNCLKNIVDCSTELTSILNELKKIRNMKNFSDIYRLSSSRNIQPRSSNQFFPLISEENPVVNEKSTSEVNRNPQCNETDLKEDSKNEVDDQNNFTSRGGHDISSSFVDIAIPESDMELDELTEAVNDTMVRRLSIINENSEISSLEGEVGNNNLEFSNSTTSKKLPKTNVNTRRGYNYTTIEYEDDSISVEAGSQLNLNSIRSNLDSIENTPKKRKSSKSFGNASSVNHSSGTYNIGHNSISNITENLLNVMEKTQLDSLSRNKSFIQRKSIGSPYPTAKKDDKSKRKSFTPRRSLPGRRLSLAFKKSKDQSEALDDSDGANQKPLSRKLFLPEEIHSDEITKKPQSKSKGNSYNRNNKVEDESSVREPTEICLDKSLAINDLSNVGNLISSTPFTETNESKIKPKRKRDMSINDPSVSRVYKKDHSLDNTADNDNENDSLPKRHKRKCTSFKYNPFSLYTKILASSSPSQLSMRKSSMEYNKSFSGREKDESKTMNENSVNSSKISANKTREVSEPNYKNSSKRRKKKTPLIPRFKKSNRQKYSVSKDVDRFDTTSEDTTSRREEQIHTDTKIYIQGKENATVHTPKNERRKKDSTKGTGNIREEDNPVKSNTNLDGSSDVGTSAESNKKMKIVNASKKSKAEDKKSGDTPSTESNGRTKRKAVQKVVYKEPSLAKKLRRDF